MGQYTNFSEDTINIPFIKIDVRESDRYILYKQGKTRFDLLSYENYGNANYGWLIHQANPELPSLEFLIQDGIEIRIPYPLETVLQEYNLKIDNYKKYYE
ncbi:MAG: hypothetical protein HUJ68_03710 [Clostridia bacterium]|nr:hypothetical protein [Clostridia bacterium]